MTRSPVRRFTAQPRPAHSRGPARVPAPASPQSADLRWVCHLGPLPMPASLTAERNYEQATPPGAARARAIRPRHPDQRPGCPGALGRVVGQPARPTLPRTRGPPELPCGRAPDGPPGKTGWRSNRACGHTMRAERRRRDRCAIGPLGMTGTDLARSDRVRARLATGYALRAGGPRPVRDRDLITPGAGAIYSTTADMARCVAALLACCRALGPLACCRAVGPRTRRHDQSPSVDERHAFPGAISLLGCPTRP
jgi:hypothetical protein